MKKTFLTLIVGLLLNMPAGAVNDHKINVTILATSDLHGVFIPWDYASDTENMSGSLSQIATKVNEIRATTPNVILVDAGDTIQGNFIETFKEDATSPMMLGFNALKYDVWVMGNHEFDFGLKSLDRSIKQFKGKVLTANIIKDNGMPFLPAYAIIEKQGVKIGIIGVSTPMTAEFAQGTDRVKGLNFVNPNEAVKNAIKQLEGKVDAIVLVSHMGLDNENLLKDTGNTDIAEANPQLDAIVAGHMHVKIGKASVNKVIITEPGKYGQALSRIDLTFELKEGSYKLVDKNSYTYDIHGVIPDHKLATIFAPYHKILRENANKPIAQLTGINLVPETRVKGIPQVQVQDTGISALYQEASHYYAPMADVIALQIDNDHARLDVGHIRLKDIAFNYQYKGGEITIYQLTGKELKRYMEWVSDYFNQVQDGDVTYSFNPQRRSSKYSTNDFFDGITYTIDLTQPVGKRITDLKLVNGQPVTDTMPIKLGMNAYRMAHLIQKGGPLAGQSFPVLFDSKAEFGEDEGTIRNMTARYLSEVKKGQYQGKIMQRWQLVGLKGYDKERKIVEELLNSGKISVPTTPDGRFTNVASINVKDKIFTSKGAYQAALDLRQKELVHAKTAVEKKHISDEIVIINALNSFN